MVKPVRCSTHAATHASAALCGAFFTAAVLLAARPFDSALAVQHSRAAPLGGCNGTLMGLQRAAPLAAASPGPILAASSDSAFGLGGRTLVIVAYNSGGNGLDPYRDTNLHFFLRQGLIANSTDYSFVIVVNGEAPPGIAALLQTIAASTTNVAVRYRENWGYDACAWRSVLNQTADDDPYAPHKYRHVIVLNMSLRGPMLTTFHDDTPWPRVFTDPLDSAQRDVRLTGLSVNCLSSQHTRWLHVQSMLWGFRAEDVPWLLHYGFPCVDNKDEVIRFNEVLLPQALLRNGSNFAVTQALWRGHDFRDSNATIVRCAVVDNDPWFGNSYAATNIDPLETIFFKSNRGFLPQRLQRLTGWQLEYRPWSLPRAIYYGSGNRSDGWFSF
jgi:hypothetical protein